MAASGSSSGAVSLEGGDGALVGRPCGKGVSLEEDCGECRIVHPLGAVMVRARYCGDGGGVCYCEGVKGFFYGALGRRVYRRRGCLWDRGS